MQAEPVHYAIADNILQWMQGARNAVQSDPWGAYLSARTLRGVAAAVLQNERDNEGTKRAAIAIVAKMAAVMRDAEQEMIKRERAE